jgi:hypothetical protein
VSTYLDTFYDLDIALGTCWGIRPHACHSCSAYEGRKVAFFDTGAQLSYYLGNSPPMARRVGETHDFNPHLGIFETPIREVDLKIGGHRSSTRFVQIPQPTPTLFELMGVNYNWEATCSKFFALRSISRNAILA